MLRMAKKEDVPAMIDIYAPYVLSTTHTFEYEVPTLAEFAGRWESITRQFPWLVWEENGAVLGYAYASPPFDRAAYAWCSEISVYLSPAVQRQGVGRRLYAVLEQILFRQGYRVIYALITSENGGSIAFHQSLGYRFTAQMPGCGIKFGRELGVIWMEKRSDVSEIPSDFPVPWRSIVENDGKINDILDNLSLS